MKTIFLFIISLIILNLCYSQETDTFTDERDGKTYKTVKIGEQIWFAENLNYVIDDTYCYDNNPDNCNKYGRLYDNLAATKVCPEGWHLPNDNEIQELINYLGGEMKAGKKLLLYGSSGFNAILSGGGICDESIGYEYHGFDEYVIYYGADFTYYFIIKAYSNVECSAYLFPEGNSAGTSYNYVRPIKDN